MNDLATTAAAQAALSICSLSLKGCPFCGAAPFVLEREPVDLTNSHYFAMCEGKECRAMPEVSGATLQDLEQAWNSRAAADGDDPADRDDGPKDSTRLNWLEAQAQLTIYEWYPAEPGAAAVFDLQDVDGETIGTGADLRAAIDDAMRGAS